MTEGTNMPKYAKTRHLFHFFRLISCHTTTNDETNMSIPLQKKESWTSSWVIFSAVEFGNKIEVSLSYDHKSVINRYTLEIQRFTRVDQ